VGLVAREGDGVVSHTIEISASALDAQSLLQRVDERLVAEGEAGCAPDGAREGRHCEWRKRDLGTTLRKLHKVNCDGGRALKV
jgi:hypothetical protein